MVPSCSPNMAKHSPSCASPMQSRHVSTCVVTMQTHTQQKNIFEPRLFNIPRLIYYCTKIKINWPIQFQNGKIWKNKESLSVPMGPLLPKSHMAKWRALIFQKRRVHIKIRFKNPLQSFKKNHAEKMTCFSFGLALRQRRLPQTRSHGKGVRPRSIQ